MDEIDSIDQCKDLSPEYLTKVLKDLRSAEKDAHESRDKFDQIKEENDYLFKKYQSMRETITGNETEIQELREKLESTIAQDRMELRERMNYLKSTSTLVLARLDVHWAVRSSLLIGKTVARQWRNFVSQRKKERTLRFHEIVSVVISGRIRSMFNRLRACEPDTRALSLVQQIVEIPGPYYESKSVEKFQHSDFFTQHVLESVSLSHHCVVVDSSSETNIPKCTIQTCEILEIISQSIPRKIESFFVIETSSISPIVAVPTSSPVHPPSDHRERRQRVLIRLLNKRIARLEFRLRKRRSNSLR